MAGKSSDSMPKPTGPGTAKTPGKPATSSTPGKGLNTGVDTGAVQPGKTGHRNPPQP